MANDEQSQNRNAVKPVSKALMSLLVGIKRRVHRHRDAKAKQADATYKAVREPALVAANYTCIFCGFRSKNTNEIHHLDDDHSNNDPKNLKCVCKLCHPYNHVGEPSKSKQSSGLEEGHLGNAARLIRVPEHSNITAQDMNHLMRVIGIALSNEDEAPRARKIQRLLADKALLDEMKASYVSNQPSDMAGAMMQLTDDEYAQREAATKNVRMVFGESFLVQMGRAIKKEQPAFANPADWEGLLQRPLSLIERAAPPAPSPGVGLDALSDDEDEDNEDDQ